MANRPRFWAPETHAERRPFLIARNEISRAVRDLFAGLEFVEVETATLQTSPGNETHIHAMRTELISPAGRDRRFLRTSPEFACKKLLAAGERRIFEFARCFRNREHGVLHHPEFTMLEWYRAHGQYEPLMDDCMAVMACAAQTAGARQFTFRDRSASPFAEPERMTVADAFDRYAGIDLMAALPPEGPDRRHFAAMANEAGVNIPTEDTWGDIFSRVLVEKVEPHLGIGSATVLDEYPAVMSALARPNIRDARLAERFEVYMCGVEIANGFGELIDAVEQRRRLAAEMAEKERIYRERYPIDDDFIAALRSMPPACGVALGFDRLVMLATGAQRIDQVMWTPVDVL
ncbi:MAG: EF-P lysine aminoacylase GenX [Rhizobiales bacterium]|nr:EF-P lysine aminoacylase GenX [Hyphomicrobiales bacterium]